MRTVLLLPLALSLVVAGCFAAAASPAPPVSGDSQASVAPHASHVTIVIMENRDYDLIAGNASAPYFNETLVPQGVLLRNSHAVAHPSEPNYLAIFSGSTHGLQSDACPVSFSSPNLAAEALTAKKTFAGYSESMPRDGYEGCYTNLYARKHNPWASFTNVPPSGNLVYRGFPPAKYPAVAFVVPNLCNDMHDCSTKTGDDWLSKNLPPIIAWDAKNDGLLIVTWDEASPDSNGTNHVATILVGPMIGPGVSDTQNVDHYGVLHTVEKIFGLPCSAKACQGSIVTGIWR